MTINNLVRLAGDIIYILWRIALTKWLYVWYCVLQNKPEILLNHPQIKREMKEAANDYKR